MVSAFDLNFRGWLQVNTKHTLHIIEPIHFFCPKRGKIKWTATSQLIDSDGEEIKRSLIDEQDLFPRYYFLKSSFLLEFLEWLDMRQLDITEVKEFKIK